MRADDLATLFAEPTSGMRLRQGVIQAWNPATGQNTVNVNGAALPDLPMLSSDQTVVLRAGDVVLVVFDGAQAWILGRVVRPGAAGFFSGAMNDETTPFTPTVSDTAVQAKSLGNWLPIWVGAMVVRHTQSLFTMQTSIAGAAATGDVRLRWYGNHPGFAANPINGTQMFLLTGLAGNASYFHDGTYTWPDSTRGTTVFVSVELKLSAGTNGVDWVSSIPSRFVSRST